MDEGQAWQTSILYYPLLFRQLGPMGSACGVELCPLGWVENRTPAHFHTAIFFRLNLSKPFGINIVPLVRTSDCGSNIREGRHHEMP
jgi:hypothetical protein